MSKQISSIDWLIKELGEYFPNGIGGIELMVKKAKAMHKEEHAQTWDKAIEKLEARGGNQVRAYVDFDDYYNQTFEQ
jgi:hypothetical protein